MQFVFQAAFVLVAIAYVAFASLLGIKAIIHRKEGWVSALLFSLMLLSLPLWIAAMYGVFLYLAPAPPDP